MQKPKLLLIGWDAADWQIMEPLLREGKMPSLSRLLQNGVMGNIATLSPPLSPMLWTSIATGKRAYDHGIHGFVEIDSARGEVIPVRSTSRKVKAAWNILNEAGLKTNVINWWPSHPAEKVNGVSVSNHFHHEAPPFGEKWPLSPSSIYPHHLSDTLASLRLHPAELTLQHVLPFIPSAAELDPEKDPVLKSTMRVLAHCSSVHNAATYVMENSEWDFMAVYYEAIDHFSHLAMKYHPPKLEGVDEDEFRLYKGIVEAGYRFHDMMLDRLLGLAGDDCHIILISDHGFHSGALRSPELPDLPAAPALEHRKYGVFAASGPQFCRNEKIYGSSLLDVAPTILHFFDLPLGEDMEGRVMNDIFRSPTKPGYINSWELTEPRPQFCIEDHSPNQEVLSQLEQLGYINFKKDEKLTYVEQELAYNLAVSLLDGHRLKEAVHISKQKWHDSKDLRFGLLGARAMLQLGNTVELTGLLDEVENAYPGQLGISFLKGLAAIQDGKVNLALENFKEMESRGVVSIELFNEIGRALFIATQLSASIGYFNKSLTIDAVNAVALTGKAQCLLELGKAAEALTLLERSLEHQFFQPNAHFLMAQAARQLGYPDIAGAALDICLKQAPRHQKARAMKAENNSHTEAQAQPIIIVSGLPRSGTSMLMKMLGEAGLPLFEDNLRPGDTHNPEGYFEHQQVKNLGLNNAWLHESRGKVLKVVSPLLRYLPTNELYKVIFIKRPLTEVILSQEVMKGRKPEEVMRYFPFQMAADLQQEETRLENWLQLQPNITYLAVEYYDCLQDPEKILKQIKAFLNISLDVEKGKKAVNKKLHRNKLGKY